MKVIAISGFKKSGKDTVANYLVDNYNFKRVSFADPLKDMVSSNFSVPRDSMDNSEQKEKPLINYPVPATDEFTSMVSNFMIREFRTLGGFPLDVKYTRNENGVLQTFTDKWENLYHTPRSLAILVGSSMRSGNPNFWVSKAIDDILKNNLLQNYVISDLRYKNEFVQLRNAFQNNLVTVRINRFENTQSTDPSEVDLIGYKHDFEIENKGTKEELFDKIVKILYNIL